MIQADILSGSLAVFNSELRSRFFGFLATVAFVAEMVSNHILQNRQLIFKPIIPYDLVADPPTGGEANLTFSIWQGLRDAFRTINWAIIKRDLQPIASFGFNTT